MLFVFVDETGDLGSSPVEYVPHYFGMALLQITDGNYECLRKLLSQVHWLCGTAGFTKLKSDSYKALNLLRGLKELQRNGVLSASSLYINKEDYGGRYLKWSESGVPQGLWPHFLRVYLLRHLLEFHFADMDITSITIDLVLDRITLAGGNRENMHDYLNSKTIVPLKHPFRIPSIQYLTIAGSEYTGGLEIAHLLCDMLKRTIKGTANHTLVGLSSFMKIKHFIGHREGDL